MASEAAASSSGFVESPKYVPNRYNFNSYEWYKKLDDGRWKCLHCSATYSGSVSSKTKKRHSERYHEAVFDGGVSDDESNASTILPVQERSSIEPSLEYFKDTGKLSPQKAQIFECVYCAKQLTKKFYRFREHLATQCPSIPEEEREAFKIKTKEKIKRLSHVATKRVRTKHKYDSDDSDIELQNDDDIEDQKERAVDILTKLLSKTNGDGGKKKPLAEFTDEDFERESKELKIKIDRLKCKELEEKARFYSKFSSGFSVIVQACHSYLDGKKRNPSGIPQSLDPSSILQAAYEESIQGENQ